MHVFDHLKLYFLPSLPSNGVMNTACSRQCLPTCWQVSSSIRMESMSTKRQETLPLHWIGEFVLQQWSSLLQDKRSSELSRTCTPRQLSPSYERREERSGPVTYSTLQKKVFESMYASIIQNIHKKITYLFFTCNYLIKDTIKTVILLHIIII